MKVGGSASKKTKCTPTAGKIMAIVFLECSWCCALKLSGKKTKQSIKSVMKYCWRTEGCH